MTCAAAANVFRDSGRKERRCGGHHPAALPSIMKEAKRFLSGFDRKGPEDVAATASTCGHEALPALPPFRN